MNFLNKFFKLKEHNTSVKTEVAAGITTFMTMAYILAVNPSILADAGMDPTAVLLATCFASFLGTALMAIWANYPFALSAGMGLNAYLAYTVVKGFGYSWQIALFAVFIEGLVFIALSLTKVREAIFNAIPLSLKNAVSVGIGLFIAFIGLQNAGLTVINDSTLVAITSFTDHFSTSGISALLAIVGTLLTALLYVKRVKGSILIGIFGTWGLGMLCQLCGIYVPDAAAGYYSLYPTFAMTDFTKIGETFGQCFNIDFSSVGIFNFIVIIFSFLFVDLFDTLGTLIGVATKADMLDKEGKLPKIRPALMADAVATTSGAILGTSTTTTFVDSAAGVAAGGRTGLSSLVTALCFFVCLFLSPVAAIVPSCATAPALIYVGVLMLKNFAKVDMSDITAAVPAFLALVMMPLTYSISNGIAVGAIAYTIITAVTGKYTKKDIVVTIIAVLFTLRFFLVTM